MTEGVAYFTTTVNDYRPIRFVQKYMNWPTSSERERERERETT